MNVDEALGFSEDGRNFAYDCEYEVPIRVLAAEVERLRAALRPFADMGRHLKDEVTDEQHWQPYIKAKCYRAAKAALEG